jgi:hypothetical protein
MCMLSPKPLRMSPKLGHHYTEIIDIKLMTTVIVRYALHNCIPEHEEDRRSCDLPHLSQPQAASTTVVQIISVIQVAIFSGCKSLD